MGLVYTVSFNAVSVSAAQDLFEVTVADDKPVKVLGLVVGQYSDVGDANAENLNLKISRGWGTSGTGGSNPTPAAVLASNTVAGPTCDANNTTVASTGTEVVLWSDVWNTQAGYMVWFPEGCQPQAAQGDGFITVRITAPADAITTNGTLVIEVG